MAHVQRRLFSLGYQKIVSGLLLPRVCFSIIKSAGSENALRSEREYLPKYTAAGRGMAQAYNCNRPSGESPQIVSLNRPDTCKASATEFYSPHDVYVT